MEIYVGIVLIDTNERIYLVKEDDKNSIGENRWNLPGGSVDGNETLIESVKRECLEETGYLVKLESVVGIYRCRKLKNEWIYVVFSGTTYARKTKIIDEGIRLGRWFDRSKFLHLDSSKLVHPDMQLVYKLSIEKKGLPIEAIKSIVY